MRVARLARLVAAGAAVSLAVLSSAGGASAVADLPAGTVRVSPDAPSSIPRPGEVLLADADWVLYAQDTYLYAMPAGGGDAISLGVQAQPSDVSQSGDVSLAGNMVVYRTSTDRRYRNLATGAAGAAPSNWATASPDGGVYGQVAADGLVHGYDQNAVSGAVTDLGVLTGFGQGAVYAIDDESGVVFFQEFPTAAATFDYVAFDDPGHEVTLQTHGSYSDRCTSLTADALGCADADHVYRVPVDGSAAAVTPVTVPMVKGDAVPFPVAELTTTQTGWWFDYSPAEDGDHTAPPYPLHSVPKGTPRAMPGKTSVDVDDNFPPVPGGSLYYVDEGSTPTDRGIYSLTSAGATPQAFHLFGAEPLQAQAQAITAGQALFVDNSGPRATTVLRVTPVHRSGSTLSTGTTRNLVTGGIGPVVASDSRVFYEPYSTAKPYATHVATLVSTTGGGAAHAPYHLAGAVPIAVSGTRAIVRRTVGTAHTLLVNLVTRRTTDLTARYGVPAATYHASIPSDVALWGRYVAYGTKDGSMDRLDLGTGKVVRIADPTSASRGRLPTAVEEWGDFVAWDYQTSGTDNASYFRNCRTKRPTVSLPVQDAVIGASVNGVVLRVRNGSTSAVVRPWTSSVTQTLASASKQVDSNIQLFEQDYPDYGAGAVYIAPLKNVKDLPRSLGNPFGARSISRTGTWHFDLPTSTVLTECRVIIRNGKGGYVRTLACGAGLMGVGEVSTSWDGKNHYGHRVSPGRFTWSVSASNDHRKLIMSDGYHGTTTGTLTVG